MSENAVEHLDVLIVGAGLSGIAAAHYLQDKSSWATYAIFEARDAIGGTWDLFRYPGIRSDSDMFTLGYSFRPWNGGKAIADGESILQYIKDTASEAGIDEHIRFNHRVLSAHWSTDDARWTVTAERSDTGERVTLTCNFFFSCSGYYRYDRGYQPDFEGMERFGGTIVHPQAWPADLDYDGKRVVVIGSGATAITLIPAMADRAAHITMLQRSPSYIVAAPNRKPASLPPRMMRWLMAVGTQGFYQLSRRWPQLVKRMLRRGVERSLPAGYDVDTHFKPKYDPWDQRLCVAPNGDLFKAISDGKASVVTDHIKTFTERGLLLESGTELDADVIVTATGLDLLFIGGVELRVDDEVVDIATRLTYKGMMLEGVPNFAIAFGYTNASWTLKCELTCDYVCRLLNEMRASGMRQCTPVNSDDTMKPQNMLSLTSSYVLRSAHKFPKQGSRFPWQVHQSYLRDYRAMKLSRVRDEAMVFSNPTSARELETASR